VVDVERLLLNVTPVTYCDEDGGDDGGHNKRYGYRLRINTPDVGVMALNVGIFDYNRRSVVTGCIVQTFSHRKIFRKMSHFRNWTINQRPLLGGMTMIP
jgi:hypothetical protein